MQQKKNIDFIKEIHRKEEFLLPRYGYNFKACEEE